MNTLLALLRGPIIIRSIIELIIDKCEWTAVCRRVEPAFDSDCECDPHRSQGEVQQLVRYVSSITVHFRTTAEVIHQALHACWMGQNYMLK